MFNEGDSFGGEGGVSLPSFGNAKRATQKQDTLSSPQANQPKYIRKRGDQRSSLQRAFDENPNWSYILKMKLASEIGMTISQVAKWNWDMRKKHGLEMNDRKKNKKAN